MTNVSRISTLARVLGAPTADSLAGGVARVAPVKRGRDFPSTLPGVEARAPRSGPMAPRADPGLLAGTALQALRTPATASGLTPPGSFAQRRTLPYPSQFTGGTLASHTQGRALRAERAPAEALMAARSGTLLLHPDMRRAAA
ncbi:hypothetical protein [Acidovorax sp. NCPPB 4044]|uniref:hypothetical protein n=1 Tax=Acidovorax sp. NCPPB 4044 TaxID=2940490 RepID=UPI00230321A8|nr:hypothetical protein [Acidovorax sp. NCPPB 4044]MDA8522548.1 hypothetical protein [Acidovorax sp. NCPPB 4044]